MQESWACCTAEKPISNGRSTGNMPRLPGVRKCRSEQPYSRMGCAGNLPGAGTASPIRESRVPAQQKSPSPAAGGTPYRAHFPQKQKGQADRLSFLIIMPWAGSPGRPGRPRAVPLPLPERRHQPSASPRAAPGLRRAATARPPSATPHGRRYAGQCRWARLRPGSPSQAGSLNLN